MHDLSPAASSAPGVPGVAGLTARRLVDATGPCLLSLGLCLSAWLAGLHGGDLAAQAYRADVMRLHGFVLWDSGWYDGTFPLSYSVLGPAAEALVGLGALAITAAVAATACFDRVVVDLMGRRTPGSWYFAACTVLPVTIGQVPYVAGEALALASVAALLRRRMSVAVALAAGALAFSPLAAAFLVLICVVWAVTDPTRRCVLLVVAAGSSAVILGVEVAFPGTGPFPFDWTGLVVIELLCATILSPLVGATRSVRLAAVLYGLANLVAFVVPNPVGGNAARLAGSVGIPAVACLVTVRDGRGSWRPAWPRARRGVLGLAALAPFVIWQWAPGTAVMASASPRLDPSTTAAFYQPLLRQLRQRSGPTPRRVEVVPTADHWEAAYVAPFVPLARGWERQLDVEDNPIFYTKGALTARSYRSWLLANGVSWVALANAPLDYAGVGEAALLRSGRVDGLTLVWSSGNWRLWRVDGSPGLVSGPARLTALAPDQLGLVASGTGTAVVRVRYSAYWRLRLGHACVTRTPAGWTALRIDAPGRIELDTALVAEPSAACAAPGRHGDR